MANVEREKHQGYTQSHWNGLYPMNMSVNAGLDNIVLLGIDVKDALGDKCFEQVEALIKEIWTPIVDKLPVYTEKRRITV